MNEGQIIPHADPAKTAKMPLLGTLQDFGTWATRGELRSAERWTGQQIPGSSLTCPSILIWPATRGLSSPGEPSLERHRVSDQKCR